MTFVRTVCEKLVQNRGVAVSLNMRDKNVKE